jgi:hypothetical protein
MTRTTRWINNPEHSPTDIDGKSVEVRIYEKSTGFRLQIVGQMRLQYHPVTSGLFCIWVAYDDSGEPTEIAMDDIDEHHLKPHPDRTKADYMCEAQYR